MDFSGKTVLVTGAALGIGRRIAVDFARHGANVAVNYSSSEEEAEKTMAEIAAAKGKGMLCKADVSSEPEAESMVRRVVEAYGGLDVLVNNAGITRFAPFEDLDSLNAEIWRRLYEVNVMGTFFCARAAAKAMGERGGVIINTSSISGHRPTGSSIAYSVSKAAVLHLTQCLAKTLGPNIRVASVSPGTIAGTRWNAPRGEEATEKAFAATAATTPLQRVGLAEDISPAVLFLASDGASFCTGADILIDGGRSLTT